MADSKLGPFLQALEGALGDVVFKHYGRKIVISRKPNFQNRVFSVAQKESQEYFKEAGRYARAAKANPEVWQAYSDEAKASAKAPRCIAIRDFLNPPRVTEVDLRLYNGRAEDKILVLATDDSGVTKVEVAVLNAQGDIVEKGLAENAGGNLWAYVATVSIDEGSVVKIEATAFDRPGHSGNLQKRFEAK